jgi:hypothetical protein
MDFETALNQARNRFANGRFVLSCHESINDVVRRENVPHARGIYVVFADCDLQRPLYVGKAGTINQDGSWKDQGLAKRLTMKQDGIYRREFFCKLMKEKSIVGLTFHWFVTHDQGNSIIPALAEMELLQAFWNQHACLPELNKCV